MKLALCHLKVIHKAVERNLNELLIFSEAAARGGADLIVAPELALTGYSFSSPDEMRELADTVPGRVTVEAAKIARDFGCYICFGLAERNDRTGEVYNSAVVLDAGGNLVARHRKITAEKNWATCGRSLSSSVFPTPWGRIGLLVCSDSYYGILPRLLALQGASLILVPANWPPDGLDPCEIWPVRARENRIFLAACNRTGKDLRLDCASARSALFGPDGKTLMAERADESRVLYCDLQAVTDHPQVQECCLPENDYQNWYSEATDFETVDISFSSRENAISISRTASSERFSCALLPDGNRLIHQPGVEPCFVESRFLNRSPVRFSFAGAHIALVSREQLLKPEVAFALSHHGCDLMLLLADAVAEEDLRTFAARSVERLAVAVSTPHVAFLAHPPEGHNRWTERRIEKPGRATWSVNLGHTRDKRYLRRIDYERFIREGDNG